MTSFTVVCNFIGPSIYNLLENSRTDDVTITKTGPSLLYKYTINLTFYRFTG